jgi:hypothetical protein
MEWGLGHMEWGLGGKLHIYLPLGGSIVCGSCRQSLVGVANLLGLEVPELQRSLTSRVMTTTKGGAVGTIIK